MTTQQVGPCACPRCLYRKGYTVSPVARIVAQLIVIALVTALAVAALGYLVTLAPESAADQCCNPYGEGCGVPIYGSDC